MPVSVFTVNKELNLVHQPSVTRDVTFTNHLHLDDAPFVRCGLCDRSDTLHIPQAVGPAMEVAVHAGK